jgi:hypothetical protein
MFIVRVGVRDRISVCQIVRIHYAVKRTRVRHYNSKVRQRLTIK